MSGSTVIPDRFTFAIVISGEFCEALRAKQEQILDGLDYRLPKTPCWCWPRTSLSGASYLVQNVNRNHGHYRLLQQSENRKFRQHPAEGVGEKNFLSGSKIVTAKWRAKKKCRLGGKNKSLGKKKRARTGGKTTKKQRRPGGEV